MTTARFFLGVSLFVVLIADICCVPVKKGQNPSPNSGGDPNAASFPSNPGAHPVYYPAGYAPNHAPSRVVSPPDSSFSQSAVQSEAAGSVGSSSRPGQPGYAANSAQSGSAAAPPPEVEWLVPPPSLSAGSQGTSAATGDLGSSRPGEVSQILPLPPPEPSYQSGELSHFERSAENGESQSEREELGYPAGHPLDVPLGPGYPNYPIPQYDLGGFWGYPYPYFDYRFLTGQYPPGTVSHFSHNYEQGRDFWQDNHYLKEHALPTPLPGQQVASFPGDFAGPQNFRDSRPPVTLPGYRPGGAGQPGSAHRVFT